MGAVKKTELYSSLWASCDALRGGMDASQYKDYILTLLFVKYVSDKFRGEPYASIVVPEGGSFNDMVAILSDPIKKKNIGEEMDKIVAKLAEANSDVFNLSGIIDNAKFNDEQKIGKGQEMVEKLEKLINIFRSDALDFRNNKAEGDDIIGDAYEYLMRKFATESGKSKGQFYTPAEVSRVLAKVVGVSEEKNRNATIYDCACGSGSLLIRAVNEAKIPLSAYGQEKESVTAGLAVMNTVLHNQPTTVIRAGNTFSDPQFFEDGDKDTLKRFDYIVANPPFSLKNWRDGLKDYGRFDGYAEVPATKGDYAWLLHILKSLKSTGKAAVILPHGVLFRGAGEAAIRKAIVSKGYIKGIIGLPENLFYGTNIAACVIVIDKEKAGLRDSIFMIDASHGFAKDGNKNRLREEDIYKIVNTFNGEISDDPTYARKIPLSEILSSENDCNLNITRYIDSSQKEDIEDLAGHVLGGIPDSDIAGMNRFWKAFPKLKEKLFSKIREGYSQLKVEKSNVKGIVLEDESFSAYLAQAGKAFLEWKNEIYEELQTANSAVPQQLILDLSEKLMAKFQPLDLVDKYDVYQVLLSYWNDTMADDVYLVSKDGFEAGTDIEKHFKKQKDGKEGTEKKLDSWDGVLIPKELLINEYFKNDKQAIDSLQDDISQLDAKVDDAVENVDEDSPLSDFISQDSSDGDADGKKKIDEDGIANQIDHFRSEIKTNETNAIQRALDEETYKGVTQINLEAFLSANPLLRKSVVGGQISKKTLQKRLHEIRIALPVPEEYRSDFDILNTFYNSIQESKRKQKELKEKSKKLDNLVEKKYAQLTLNEIKPLVIDEKWLGFLQANLASLYSSISQVISSRIVTLADRYKYTLGEIDSEIANADHALADMLKQLRVNDRAQDGNGDGVAAKNTADAIAAWEKLLSSEADKK